MRKRLGLGLPRGLDQSMNSGFNRPGPAAEATQWKSSADLTDPLLKTRRAAPTRMKISH